MRKFLFLAVAFFTFAIVNAQQDVVKVNPLGLVFGSFNAAYEHALSDKSSLEIGANYFNWKNLNLAGFGGEVAYHFYFSKNNDAPEGIYAAPFLSANGLSYTYTEYTYTNTVVKTDSAFGIGGGVKAGYQWIFDSGLALDLFFGYGYTSLKFKEADYNYSGGLPRLGLSVGYAF